jgi:hypothetical protein
LAGARSKSLDDASIRYARLRHHGIGSFSQRVRPCQTIRSEQSEAHRLADALLDSSRAP